MKKYCFIFVAEDLVEFATQKLREKDDVKIEDVFEADVDDVSRHLLPGIKKMTNPPTYHEIVFSIPTTIEEGMETVEDILDMTL